MKTVVIEFKKGGTQYSYQFKGEVAVGDIVRVDSFFDGVTPVTVVAVKEGVGPKATAWAWK